MENIYDIAYHLADAIRETDQHKQYVKTKEAVFADDNNKRMIEDLRKLQFEAQSIVLSGKEPPADLMDKIRKLGEILQFNPQITAYFSAEYAMQTIAYDMYKIIRDACGLDEPELGDS